MTPTVAYGDLTGLGKLPPLALDVTPSRSVDGDDELTTV